MKSFFVGNKTKPAFLVEINKKTVNIYKPDKYSKNEEFYEKYSLGTLVIDTKFNNITFSKTPVSYKTYHYVPEIIFKIKDKYLSVSKTIKLSQ